MSKKKHKISAGKQEVYKERFNLPRYNTNSASCCKVISNVVPQVFKKLGLKNNLLRLELEQHWKEMAGSVLAKHTHPGNIFRGELVIYVDHPAWLQELKHSLEKPLLKKIQQRFPEMKIKCFAFRLE